jgi:8-oxo-dGTP pyrophosphatase MutT (NUDIX family)
MSEPQSFGHFDPSLRYEERRAAYAVIIAGSEVVGAIKGAGDKYWLPGGGSLSGEAAEETIIREVREELGRGVRLIEEIGNATQYFYAVAEDRNYKMEAAFFRAELIGAPSGPGEHELHWLPLGSMSNLFFHQCHAWAVEQAVLMQSLGNSDDKE